MHATRLLLPALALLLLTGQVHNTLAATAEPQEGKLRVLVITGGHAYEEAPFQAMFAAIPDIQVEMAQFPEAAQRLTPKLADQKDVVVFYDMWAKGFTPSQQKAFLALLQRGIGVVALHHTLAAHQQWPEYEKIIGGKYHLEPLTVDGKQLPASSYYHDQDMKIEIADATHPITRGLKSFEIHDEAYQDFSCDPAATLLLTTDYPKSDREIAWTKNYASSRVVYIELGHDHLAYENPNYREIVARSIRYVAARPADPQAPFTKLFNGKDLSGWSATGNARWQVNDGLLVGRQGPNYAPGDLFTDASYDDFELRVTYRVVWPANSGVWYRYQSGKQAYQADILEYADPFALSGTLYRPGVPGKPFIAINTDASIFDKDGWNTLVIRAAGDRQVIFLNGVKTADVHDSLSAKGKIGFQVHPGNQFGDMQIVVRTVEIRPL